MKASVFKKYKKGHQVDTIAKDKLIELLGYDADYSRDQLIEHLHMIQDHFHCLPEKYLVALASLMKISPTMVYEVATFYHHFDVVKEGKTLPPEITVRVCQSMSCHMSGSRELLDNLINKYQKRVRIQKVPCVGICDQAPVAVVGKNPITKANVDKVDKAVSTKDVNAPMITDFKSYDTYTSEGGYGVVKKIDREELSSDDIITLLKNNSLKGLGGAGFPTGLKWEIVANEKAPRYLVVNLDEGEPGTIKDGYYLSKNPHQFLEGVLIAMKVVDCIACYIYIRDEYASAYRLLLEEINVLKSRLPNLFAPIYVRRGAGAYICGEESALIESLEGKRGMPRLRPPFVANVGLFNRPTLVNNFETLYWIPRVVSKGFKWFVDEEGKNRQTMRSYSVSGRVKKPGVVLAPAGISVNQLINEYCGGMLDGHSFYGYFPGGASGGILPASLGDVALDFGTLQEYGCFIGSAAVIVFSDKDSAKELALIAMSFFRDESCGQCTPCSIGTDKASQLMSQSDWNKPLLSELAQTMRDASICGLGQAAPNPMMSVIRYFPNELD